MGFSLQVIDDGIQSDRKITLQNYSAASAFHGRIDEQRVYNGIIQP